MKKKTIVAALLLCAVGFGAFAEVGTYFKGVVGYGYRWGMDWFMNFGGLTYQLSDAYRGADYVGIDTHLGMVVPTLGIEPWRESGNVFLRGLSFEFSLGLGLGRATFNASAGNYSETTDLGTSIIIDPRVMVVYTHRAGMIAPYFGAGVSGHLAIITSEDPMINIDVNGNIMAGIGFMVTPSVMPVIEVDFGFGTSMRIDARAGIVYRFGM